MRFLPLLAASIIPGMAAMAAMAAEPYAPPGGQNAMAAPGTKPPAAMLLAADLRPAVADIAADPPEGDSPAPPPPPPAAPQRQSALPGPPPPAGPGRRA